MFEKIKETKQRTLVRALCTTMKSVIIILFILLKTTICWTQIDSVFLFEDDKEVLEFIYFENDKECQEKNIELLNVDVIHCDSLHDKTILPSKYHKHYISSRLIDFDRKNDTLKITLIGFSGCCAHFYARLKCVNDTTLDLLYDDIDEIDCFCGGCPYLFSYTAIDKNKTITTILLNGNEISFLENIYTNGFETKKRNFFNGKTIVKTYNERVSDNNLILEKHYNRKGNLLLTKTYYLGKETNE